MFKVNFRGIILYFLLFFFVAPTVAFAQSDRSYFYENISQSFVVNSDTTVDVEEVQTYNFNGEYNKGWRSIPLNKVTDITNISIIDTATGKYLEYSSNSLEKTDPSNWGKYTYHKKNGNLEIEWYYNAKNVSRTWIIRYRLIGALSFLQDKDEFYWNLFTDYDVFVEKVEARVKIPEGNYLVDSLSSKIYTRYAENEQYKIAEDEVFVFSAQNIQPRGAVTIAAGWPIGLVNRDKFWLQFVSVHYVPISIFFVVITTIISMILYWYFTEKRHSGRGTIVPEYTPPQNLPPAMAELIVKERITPKAWAATVVDLAVRGHLKIVEDKNRLPAFILFLAKGLNFFLPILFITIFVVVIAGGFTAFKPWLLFPLVILIFISVRAAKKSSAKPINSDYIVESVGEWQNNQDLRQYERKFLASLLKGGRFSTKKMRDNVESGREMYFAIQKVTESLYEETETDTKAYDKLVSKEGTQVISFFILIVGVIVSIVFSTLQFNGLFIIILVILFCVAFAVVYFKFEARLSRSGEILREEWLGFRLYLKTAERYRMQNLTSETFEKYLPYAIIFGVEKPWGKAFEGISMQPPSWYGSNSVIASHSSAGNFGGSNFSSGFSAGAFSASFASSFTSAFSSSGGGGGASGGGGGAGGGGGGGGGGAS